ncbi:uncharacterized protein METZ01_LOCUS171386, partial [marine metagenome]
QKIVSSGTPDLEKATVILEKWFDDLQIKKEQKQATPTIEENKTKSADDIAKIEDDISVKNKNKEISKTNQKEDIPASPEVKTSVFDKLKNIKLSKSNLFKTSGTSRKNKFYTRMQNFFKSKVSKMSVAGEEIVGVDISYESIHVAQVNKDKSDKWILDKFSYRLLDKAKTGDNLIENKEYLSDEIKLALANAKITSTNVALSIPVTSAIIRVVESPLMSEEELKKAIETDSLWENMDILTDNLNDYSVFHQVINRNSKNNTMDILFVASKLSDVNAFSSIIKKSNLNPVIMDVRCFTLKNAFDNIAISAGTNKNSAIMEFGLEENYLMIIHNNIPIITDIFLRPQEKQSILEADPSQENDESRNVIRRYAMQIKQAINDYETKYESKINSINVVSGLKNIKVLIPMFKKNLPTTGFKMFDPLMTMSVPEYNKDKINQENVSVLTSVLGLAFRKLDVFGYYKFVTAVKNINLLPNRDAVRQQNKIKFLSGFALKGFAGAIAGIYLLLIGLSFFQYNSNKEKLLTFDQVQGEFDRVNSRYSKLMKKKNEMQLALKLGKQVNSNQIQSYRALAQITRSVPVRVQFTKMEFDGSKNISIQGSAFSDQDILNFIANLNSKSLIEQASLVSMDVSTSETEQSSSNKKGFTILCKLKGV